MVADLVVVLVAEWVAGIPWQVLVTQCITYVFVKAMILQEDERDGWQQEMLEEFHAS